MSNAGGSNNPGNAGVVRINGSAGAMQNLSGNLQSYICYASSPGAYSRPNANPIIDADDRLINIFVTGNHQDESQKNFEVLLMSIGLRAMPVVLTDPVAVQDLSLCTNLLSGEGFVWKFAVERGFMFQNFTPYGTPGPVGLLIDELDGVVLPSGVRVTTTINSQSGWPMNIVFSRTELL